MNERKEIKKERTVLRTRKSRLWERPGICRAAAALGVALLVGSAPRAARADDWTRPWDLIQPLRNHAAVGGPTCIFVAGGNNIQGQIVSEVDCYDVSGVPLFSTDLPEPRNHLMLAYSGDGLLYAIGGCSSDGVHTSRCDCLDPSTGIWTRLPDMPESRDGGGAAFGPDGNLYVFGGYNQTGPLTSTYCFDLETQRWQPRSRIRTPRRNLAGVEGADGLLYAIGGFDTANRALNTVETYDALSDQWRTIEPLPTPRGALAAVAHDNGSIYVFGGSSNNQDVLNNTEFYNPFVGFWRRGLSMPTPRANLAAAAGYDGRIYVLGGRAPGSTATSIVEAYIP